MFVDTGDTLGGWFRSFKTPIRLTGCSDFSAETPPKLGEHNREILQSLGYSDADVQSLKDQSVI